MSCDSLLTNHYLKVQLLLNQLADGFYSFALALDVFMDIIAHGIEVVEEIGKGRLNHVRLAVVLVRKRVHQHLDALFFQVNINLCTRHYRVTIIMDYAWLTAGDMKFLAAE